MDRKNYFNFLAFRKGLYDIDLSERARLIYIHLLQKSSAKGSDEVELTKSQIASDLGILTIKKDKLALKNVQRALEELEEHGYLRRWQKFKGEDVPLTIKLNLYEGFLRQKREENGTGSDNNERPGSEKPSENVHPYNPSLSTSNPSLSDTNPNLSDLSAENDLGEKEEEKEIMEEEFSTEIPDETKTGWRGLLEQFHQRIKNAENIAELDSATHEFKEAVTQVRNLPDEFFSELDKIKEEKETKVYILKAKTVPF